MLDDLQHCQDEYKQSPADGMEQICAAMLIDGDHAIVALCTPLMKHVHSFIKNSGELVSCMRVDLYNYRSFLLHVLLHSAGGGLPLGYSLSPARP